MKPVVIFGAEKIAELALFYFENDSPRDVTAFCVDAKYRKGDELFGKPLVDFEDVETIYPPDDFDLFVATSYVSVNRLRADKVEQAKQKGYTLASYVSTMATTFKGFEHGENCFILEDNTIQPFAKIGSNVTLWSGNHIAHHSTIEDNVFVTSKCVVAGCCVVKQNSFLGAASTLCDNIVVAPYNFIGAASYVAKSTEEYGIYRGNPAKKAKIRSIDMRGL